MNTLHFLHFSILGQMAECIIVLTMPSKDALFGHELVMIKLPTLYQCIDLCVSLKLCRSVAFGKAYPVGNCTLYSADFNPSGPWTVTTPTRLMERSEIPQGYGWYCSGNPCAIDERCIQTGQSYVCVKHEYSTVRCLNLWGRLNDHCVMVFHYMVPWIRAKEYCEQRNAEVLTFDTLDEYESNLEMIRHVLLKIGYRYSYFGYIWLGMPFQSRLPSWLPLNDVKTNDTNLCMSLNFAKRNGFFIERMEPVSCSDECMVSCQQRNPPHWS